MLLAITRLMRGGAQQEVLDLVAGLDRQRFAVALACHPEGEWTGRGRGCADEFYPIPDLVREISPLRDLRAAAQFARVMRRGRFDIVHTHTSKAGMVGRLAACLVRVPVVIHTPHGSVFSKSFLSPAMQRAVTVAERVAGRWCDTIITKSESEREEYLRRRIAPPEKFVTIPCGLDFARLQQSMAPREATRQGLGIDDGRALVLYAARFVPEKDHATFLRAFARVLERRPETRAVLAGDGPLREAVERDAATMLPPGSLVSLGFREDVAGLMLAADVCVSASLSEGLPLMVGEALALGRPVVATDAGGTREIVLDGETGLLVPCADPKALAEGILQVLEDPSRVSRLAQAGRHRVRATLDVSHMVRRTGELYRVCLAQAAAAGRIVRTGG